MLFKIMLLLLLVLVLKKSSQHSVIGVEIQRYIISSKIKYLFVGVCNIANNAVPPILFRIMLVLLLGMVLKKSS
jgi:hypothetical protein